MSFLHKSIIFSWTSFVDHWNYDDVSEDFLKQNVWTPAIDTKVCVLGDIPKAKGLFHKMVPISGSVTEAQNQEYSRKLL